MFPFSSILSATPSETASLGGASRGFVGLQPDDGNIILSISAVSGGNNRKRGYVQWDGFNDGEAVSYQDLHTWVLPTDFDGTYYVRATLSSGSAPDAGSLGSWTQLIKDVNNVFWRWTHGGPIPISGTLLLELCTVGDGSNIVASGSYVMTVSSES